MGKRQHTVIDPLAQAAGVRHEFEESVMRTIYESTPAGILTVDRNNVVVSHNRRFLEIMGIPVPATPGDAPASLSGTSDGPLLAAVVDRVSDPDGFLKRVKELYAHPDEDDHCEILLKDGRTLERYSWVVRHRNGDYLGRVWIFWDVTYYKQMENHLRKAREQAEVATAAAEQLATHDSLSGLYNRRAIIGILEREIARQEREQTALSVCMVDVDHFKNINDTRGHHAGDELLKQLCSRMQSAARSYDAVGRYGGDEFVVVLTNCDVREAGTIAERIRSSVASPEFSIEGQGLTITVSVGVSQASPVKRTGNALLQAADEALYRAKRKGRNRVEVGPARR